VFQVCAFLPLIGLLTGFLPDLEGSRRKKLAS
jgi:FSR family fosmidomycin resistance protein-like MFS transporter